MDTTEKIIFLYFKAKLTVEGIFYILKEEIIGNRLVQPIRHFPIKFTVKNYIEDVLVTEYKTLLTISPTSVINYELQELLAVRMTRSYKNITYQTDETINEIDEERKEAKTGGISKD